MAEYRVYIVGSDGHFLKAIELVCPDSVVEIPEVERERDLVINRAKGRFTPEETSLFSICSYGVSPLRHRNVSRFLEHHVLVPATERTNSYSLS
jgi:hypothetical protein